MKPVSYRADRRLAGRAGLDFSVKSTRHCSASPVLFGRNRLLVGCDGTGREQTTPPQHGSADLLLRHTYCDYSLIYLGKPGGVGDIQPT